MYTSTIRTRRAFGAFGVAFGGGVPKRFLPIFFVFFPENESRVDATADRDVARDADADARAREWDDDARAPRDVVVSDAPRATTAPARERERATC